MAPALLICLLLVGAGAAASADRPPPAAAAADGIDDPQQIEEGEPITLQDELTNEPGELSLEYSGAYRRTGLTGARETLEQGPTLKLGVFQNVQVSLNPNYATGRAEEANAGDVLGDVLLHVNDQARLIPATGLDLFASTPFGAGHKSASYVMRAIASWSLGMTEGAPRFHVNLTDTHLAEPEIGTRKDQLQLALGGSFLLTDRGAIVADLVHGAAEERHATETFMEIGYVREFPHEWNCKLGFGRQVTGPGNAVRVFFSVEKEVHVF